MPPPPTWDAQSWESDYARYKNDGDAGGITIIETRKSSGGSDVKAKFRAYDEELHIWDRFNNDRPALVRLWVGDGGPAVFYSSGTFRKIDLSYAEGQRVNLQVCTSASPNAECTSKSLYPGRT